MLHANKRVSVSLSQPSLVFFYAALLKSHLYINSFNQTIHIIINLYYGLELLPIFYMSIIFIVFGVIS